MPGAAGGTIEAMAQIEYVPSERDIEDHPVHPSLAQYLVAALTGTPVERWNAIGGPDLGSDFFTEWFSLNPATKFPVFASACGRGDTLRVELRVARLGELDARAVVESALPETIFEGTWAEADRLAEPARRRRSV